MNVARPEAKQGVNHDRASPYFDLCKRFAKFGWQTRTFCHKKVGKVIAKLESDRL